MQRWMNPKRANKTVVTFAADAFGWVFFYERKCDKDLLKVWHKEGNIFTVVTFAADAVVVSYI